MSRIFWDTNLFVYLMEDQSELSEQVDALRRRMVDRGDQLLTSALTLGEVLVKPFESGRDDLARAYEQTLTAGALIVAFEREAARRYAQIRADRTIKPPDAIQLACAAQAAADLFVTNDDRLSRKAVPGIHFITSLQRVPM